MDFQKLLFLYCQETKEIPIYEFIPYRDCGFSFTSYADKRHLIRVGLLADDERGWTLTEDGRAMGAIAPSEQQRMEIFARQYAELRGDMLLAEAYRRHPYYAIRSEIAAGSWQRSPSLAAVAAALRWLVCRDMPSVTKVGASRVT